MDPPAFSTQQSSSNSQQAKYIDISKDGAAPVDPNPTAAAANLSEISTTSGNDNSHLLIPYALKFNRKRNSNNHRG